MRSKILVFVPFLVLSMALPAAGPAAADEGWPREIQKEKYLVVIYQPQIDRLERDRLYARAAVSVTPAGKEEPVFGAAWMDARIVTDLDTRTVTFRDLSVPRVRFPDATPEQEKGLIDLLMAEMPRWDLEMSLDRLQAALEIADRQSAAAEGFYDGPPKILFREEPAVLVVVDGPPQLRELEGTGIQAVVNSPFLIVQDPQKTSQFYLYAGAETWYIASAVEGPWAVTKRVPKKIRRLEPKEEEEESVEGEKRPDKPPAIVVSTESAELIVFDGRPQYTPIAGGELLVVSNTESDVLVEVATQRTFVLLSGRWFAGPGFDGPWEFVPSDGLPASFLDIDPDSDQGYLLTWVAGSELAEETVLDAYVPQTAAVKRDATIEVAYDGEPKFEPVEGTAMYYAVNTQSQVIRVGSRYYCAAEGVWYTADNPKGPWRVATDVPDEIYTIPASNPNYNVTYVQVYESTPQVVYVGYYPGYTWSYPYHGCLVYGTGWHYRPWWGPYRYYPRHHSWGFHVRWNPWYGWGFGFSYSTGPFTFSVGFGGWHRYGWWGPAGFHGYHRGYHRGWHHGWHDGARAGYRAGYRAGQWDARRNIYQRPGNIDRVARTSAPRGARSPSTVAQRPNNIYTDRNGNVYRRQSDGTWQTREGGQWKQSEAGAAARSRAETAAGQRGAVAGSGERQRPSGGSIQRPPGNAASATRSRAPSGGSSLNRDHHARQRGAQRSSSFHSSGASRSRSGAARPGGARRGGARPGGRR